MGGRTFKQMGGKVPGMPGTLTDDQVQETLKKFEIHEKIVNAMTDKERADPQIMLDDVENTDENCPLIQRVARLGLRREGRRPLPRGLRGHAPVDAAHCCGRGPGRGQRGYWEFEPGRAARVEETKEEEGWEEEISS